MDERDLTFRELARRCPNLHWTTANHIVVGTRQPNHETCRQLAIGLEMDLAEVMRAYGLNPDRPNYRSGIGGDCRDDASDDRFVKPTKRIMVNQ